jgi:hypothetical protein
VPSSDDSEFAGDGAVEVANVDRGAAVAAGVGPQVEDLGEAVGQQRG